MNDTTTRRSSRTPVTLKIKFKSESLAQFIERYSVDVSRGGIFIRTKDPLPVGTPLSFEFHLQDNSPLVSGDGTVVWIREHDAGRQGVAPGMGVRFDKLTPESQVILERILAEKEKQDAGGMTRKGATPAQGVKVAGAGGLSFGPRPFRLETDDEPTVVRAAPEGLLEAPAAPSAPAQSGTPSDKVTVDLDATGPGPGPATSEPTYARTLLGIGIVLPGGNAQGAPAAAAAPVRAGAFSAATLAMAEGVGASTVPPATDAADGPDSSDGTPPVAAPPTRSMGSVSDSFGRSDPPAVAPVPAAIPEIRPLERHKQEEPSAYSDARPMATAYDEPVPKKSYGGVVVAVGLLALAGGGAWYFLAGPGASRPAPVAGAAADGGAAAAAPAVAPAAAADAVTAAAAAPDGGAAPAAAPTPPTPAATADAGTAPPAAAAAADGGAAPAAPAAPEADAGAAPAAAVAPTPAAPAAPAAELPRTLTVTSEPAGAAVSIDGKTRGKTPFTLSGKELRKPHKLEVKLRGHKSFTQEISATEGWTAAADKETLAVTATLEKEEAPAVVAPKPRRVRAAPAAAPKEKPSGVPEELPPGYKDPPVPPPIPDAPKPAEKPKAPAPAAEPKPEAKPEKPAAPAPKKEEGGGLKTPAWGN